MAKIKTTKLKHEPVDPPFIKLEMELTELEARDLCTRMGAMPYPGSPTNITMDLWNTLSDLGLDHVFPDVVRTWDFSYREKSS